MERFKSITDFKALQARLIADIDAGMPTMAISAGTCGQASGANDIIRLAKRALFAKGLRKKIRLRVTGCQGYCQLEPSILVEPQRIFYPKVARKDVERIVDAVAKGEILEDLLFTDPETKRKIANQDELPFFRKQVRTILASSEKIDPIRIYDYIKNGGYSALVKILEKADTKWVVNEIKISGLRGRGGGGFSTGLKWEFLANQPNGRGKYLICNADEGDPGAYMDRSVLEGNPHSVIEGMIIGAYGTGATEGIVYVRNEYPLAVKHLIIALRRANEMGLLGQNILGTDLSFDIKIVKGAGAFVCGEETALIASIESKRGFPRQRPPFPVVKGLWDKPTAINNVETWANVPEIIKKGGNWFASIGTEKSKGTKIFSLVGKVCNTGLVEIPMGIVLRELVVDIGGGPPNGKKIKSVQIGGPSGGCIPQNLFHLPIDYESLASAGTIMGSGGMIVMDESTCMVDVARYFSNFLREESCGKCTPCRMGTQKMYEIITRITKGRGKEEDLALLEELGNTVKNASLCGLGQTAANPALATIRYFKNEYLEHILKKRCNAVVCKEIVSAPCQHTCPIDTEASVYVSLIAQKRYTEALEIIKKDNPLASVLSRVCHHPCETKCRAGDAGEPISIRNLKRFATDYGLKENLILKAETPTQSKKDKVAIVGSGPAGLTCGFYLAQNGYNVTIFEKHSVAGGMLALGIPEYRLPREILKTDIDYIESAGVEIRTNCALGKDFTLDDLFARGYKAVFLATGAYESLKLGVPGEDAEGVMSGMQVLTSINLGKDIKIGKRVGVVGGGNSAVDVARTVLRKGISENVTIFYRRTIAEMPAFKDEVEAAIAEGIKIQFLTAPKNVITENGRLKSCEFIKMELGEADDSGRRKPVPIKGSEYIAELDTLISAISEYPDISFIEKAEGFKFSKWGTVVVDNETFLTTKPGVFAGGDLVTGPNTVVNACASGKIAAESIDQFLSGKKVKREYKITRPSRYIEPLKLSDDEVENLLSAKRPKMSQANPAERVSDFKEVDLGLTEQQAVVEAMRCLRCDLETEEGCKFLEELKESSAKKN